MGDRIDTIWRRADRHRRDIVTAPADDYVADFAVESSPEGRRPRSCCSPPSTRPWQARHGRRAQRAREDDLDTLVELSTHTDHPVLIKPDGYRVVDKTTLLHGLQGARTESDGYRRPEQRDNIVDRDVSIGSFVDRNEGYFSGVFEQIQRGKLPV